MTELHKQQCHECSPDEALSTEECAVLLQQLEPPWQHDENDKSISHRYSFKNFYQTMAFANVIAQIAHQQDHHPDLSISYNRCTVNYSTHSVGGLSLNDFICAARINAAMYL